MKHYVISPKVTVAAYERNREEKVALENTKPVEASVGPQFTPCWPKACGTNILQFTYSMYTPLK